MTPALPGGLSAVWRAPRATGAPLAELWPWAVRFACHVRTSEGMGRGYKAAHPEIAERIWTSTEIPDEIAADPAAQPA